MSTNLHDEELIIQQDVESDEVRSELEKVSQKYHLIGAWIAVVFVPLFGFTDYLNIPDNWLEIFSIRVFISLLTLVILLMRNRWKLPSFIIVLIPFVLISLQNAYTYSLIDKGHLMAHTLNYMALLIGGAMFLFWRWYYSVIVVIISGVFTYYYLQLNPRISTEDFVLGGGLLLSVVAVFMILLIQTRYRLNIREIVARLRLRDSNKALAEQKGIIETKNRNITESIDYAKRIQEAIIGGILSLDEMFKGSFVINEPKDILSGDFYYFYQDPISKTRIIAVADCTGHGVPAALMTILGANALKEIVETNRVLRPHLILKELDKSIVSRLKSSEDSLTLSDGMDICVLAFDSDYSMEASAAMSTLCLVQNGKLNRIRGSRFPVGDNHEKIEKNFELHQFQLAKGDKIYLFTDGYQDQYGGPVFKKFMSRTFRELLLSTSQMEMPKQKQKLDETLRNWKGKADQTDDILVVGLEV